MSDEQQNFKIHIDISINYRVVTLLERGGTIF